MKQSELFLLSLVLIVIITFGVIKYINPHIKEKTRCDLLVDSLSSVNDSIDLRIAELNGRLNEYQLRLDSLKRVKNRVITEYISIYEEIDSADVDDLSNEFKVVFTKHLGE